MVYLQSVTKMVDRIRKFQILHNQIFAVLHKYLKPMEADDETFMIIKEIDPPPPDPELVKNRQTLGRRKGTKLKKRRKNHCPVSPYGSFTLRETDPHSDSCPTEKQGVGIKVQVCAV